MRLFLALVPGAGVRAALARHCDQWRWPATAARYAPADWHMTLHFIGAVAPSRLQELHIGLAVPVVPFNLRLGRPELWPHGLAVVCPEAVPAGLRQLQARLGQALQQMGLATDPRSYRPHLTLARHAQDAVAPLPQPLPDWPVTGYVLMASTGQAPPRYRVLQTYGAPA